MTEDQRQLIDDEVGQLIDNLFILAKKFKDNEITAKTLRDLVAMERRRHTSWIENLVAEEVRNATDSDGRTKCDKCFKPYFESVCTCDNT